MEKGGEAKTEDAEEEKLAGHLLEIKDFCPLHTWEYPEEETPEDGRTDETRWKGESPNKNNRDNREYFGNGIESSGQTADVYSEEMPCQGSWENQNRVQGEWCRI